MPHVTLEFTNTLESRIRNTDLLKAVHMAVVNCGLFDPSAIKSRMVGHNEVLWNTSAEPIEFLHVSVAILEGRPLDKKEALSQAIFAELNNAIPDIPKHSVEIRDMEAATYSKD